MSSHVKVARRGIAGLAALCLGTSLMLIGTPAGAASAPVGRVSFPGSVPSFVTAANDVGPAADTTVETTVYLSLKDPAGAQAFGLAVSTPGNPLYGKYLSPYAWISKYSPSVADFNAVKAFLVASGETIYATPASRQYIVARGPASTTGPTFGTTLRNYRVAGKVVSAPASSPTLPASIATKVVGVVMGNARAVLTRPDYITPDSKPSTKLKTGAKSPSASKAVVPAAVAPCSSYWGEYFHSVPLIYGQTTAPSRPCGYLPSQLRASANVNKIINAGIDGTGQTIAIVDAYASPTILQDTNSYMLAVSEPLLTKFQQLNPGAFQDEALCQEPSGWQEEESLDVEVAHSIAPGAKIVYSGGFDCEGGLDIAVSKILDGHLATMVSNSYGGPEVEYSDAQISGEIDIDAQAAGEGIGLNYSSGDSGDYSQDFGFATPQFVSSLATSVGGTSVAIDGLGKNVFTTGWGTVRDQIVDGAYQSPLPGDFYGGAGGGPSAVLAEPAYQKGVVPVALSTDSYGDRVRVQPDVADLADPYTGFEIALSPIIDDTTLATGPLEYENIGGTSLASPLYTGKTALVQALDHKTIGFANPLIYQSVKNNHTAFTDVLPLAVPQILYFKSPTTGLERTITFDQDLSLVTTKGYDDVTGNGTINVGALAKYLAAQ